MKKIIGVLMGIVITACFAIWLQPPWYAALALGMLIGVITDMWVNTWKID